MIQLLTLPVLLLPLAVSGDGDSLAVLHPDDALVYLEAPDLVALLAAYQETALMQLLHDEQLGGLVASLTGKDPQEFDLVQEGLSMAMSEAPPIAQQFLPLAAHLRSLSFSLTCSGAAPEELVSQAMQGSDSWQQSVGLQWLVSCDDAEQAHALFESAAPLFAGDPRVEPVAIAAAEQVGGEGLSLQLPATPALGLLRVGRHVALLFAQCCADDAAAAIARLSGGSASHELAAQFAKAHALGGASGVVAFEGYSRLSMDQVVVEAGDFLAGPGVDLIEAWMGPIVTMLARGGDWSVRLHEGRFVTKGVAPRSRRKGLFGSQAVGGRAAAFLHPDAVLAFVSNLERETLTELISKGLESAGAEGQLSAMDEQFHFRPDRDLIAKLGGTISVSIPPLRSMMSAPTVLALADLHDAPAFTEGLRNLARIMPQLTDQVTFTETNYKDRALFTLEISNPDALAGGLPINPAAMIKPTLAVLDDRLLIAMTLMQAKKEVRRQEKIEDGPSPVLDGYDVPAASTQVVFADWGTFVGKLYTSLRAMAPMLNMNGDLPFDPEALPDAEVFTHFFQPTVRYQLEQEDGTHHLEWSSLGPELSLLAAGVVIVPRLTAMRRFEQLRPPEPAPEARPDEEPETSPEDASGGGGAPR